MRRAAFEVVDLQAAPAVLDEESRGLEMGVAADHGARVGVESVNDFLSAVEAGVDQDAPLAITRGGMAEQYLSRAVYGQAE